MRKKRISEYLKWWVFLVALIRGLLHVSVRSCDGTHKYVRCGKMAAGDCRKRSINHLQKRCISASFFTVHKEMSLFYILLQSFPSDTHCDA
jgi:hypothetical protein